MAKGRGALPRNNSLMSRHIPEDLGLFARPSFYFRFLATCDEDCAWSESVEIIPRRFSSILPYFYAKKTRARIAGGGGRLWSIPSTWAPRRRHRFSCWGLRYTQLIFTYPMIWFIGDCTRKSWRRVRFVTLFLTDIDHKHYSPMAWPVCWAGHQQYLAGSRGDTLHTAPW